MLKMSLLFMVAIISAGNYRKCCRFLGHPSLDSNEQLPRFDMPQKITEDGFSSDGASSDCPSDDGQGMDFIDNICM